MSLLDKVGRFLGSAAETAKPFVLQDQEAKINEARDQRLNQYATARDNRLIAADDARETQRQAFTQGENKAEREFHQGENKATRDQATTYHLEEMKQAKLQLEATLARLGIERESASIVDALNNVKLTEANDRQAALLRINDPDNPPEVRQAAVDMINAANGKSSKGFELVYDPLSGQYIEHNKDTGEKTLVDPASLKQPGGLVPAEEPKKESKSGSYVGFAFDRIMEGLKSVGGAAASAAAAPSPRAPGGTPYSGVQRGAGGNPNVISDAVATATAPLPRGPQSGLQGSPPTGAPVAAAAALGSSQATPIIPKTQADIDSAPPGTWLMVEGQLYRKR